MSHTSNIEPQAQARSLVWASLNHRFFAAKDAVEQARIFDLSTQVADRLEQRIAVYDQIRTRRVWPVALTMAAAAPFASVDALTLSSLLSLWVFACDDLFDEELLPQAELMARVDHVRAMLRDWSTIPVDSLTTILVEARNELARYPLFAALIPEWVKAVNGTLDAMIREYAWRVDYGRKQGESSTVSCHQQDGGALPPYADYMASGRYTAGSPLIVVTNLITLNDRSTLLHLPHLLAMEQLTSLCIRLANDLRSYAKDVSEGNLNAILFHRHALLQQGVAMTKAHHQAEEQIRAVIARSLDELNQLQVDTRTQTGEPEAMIAGLARFACAFYAQHDYHTLPTEQQEGLP